MSEDPQVAGPAEPEPDSARPEQVRTGVDSVDAVIAAVEELEERPIEEHVGVFETAHEQLRKALDAQPGPERPAPGRPAPPADRPS
ncbi:hypothetical protein ACT8ZV_12100 [Nocardioides sp. MAHUQ-72]|uniref:hypothetical protein n=1 Tax=unclassified Nocardioides TaxID=2615069 RepID=UPI00360EF6A8